MERSRRRKKKSRDRRVVPVLSGECRIIGESLLMREPERR